MTTLTIDLTPTEFQAMEYAALSVQDWADNAVTNRARIAIDEIVDICVKQCLANGIQIPGTKEDIVALAFANGYVKTAAQRNADAELAAQSLRDQTA